MIFCQNEKEPGKLIIYTPFLPSLLSYKAYVNGVKQSKIFLASSIFNEIFAP